MKMFLLKEGQGHYELRYENGKLKLKSFIKEYYVVNNTTPNPALRVILQNASVHNLFNKVCMMNIRLTNLQCYLRLEQKIHKNNCVASDILACLKQLKINKKKEIEELIPDQYPQYLIKIKLSHLGKIVVPFFLKCVRE